MEYYVGLDVSLKQTSICVVNQTGSIVQEGVVDSDLPSVFLRHPPAHVIAAVPLKPPARIIVMKPAFEAPLR
jgi:hypothetical protein